MFKLYWDRALQDKSHKTYIHSFSLFANHHILYMNNFILQWQKREILHRVDTFVKIVKTNFSLCPLFCFSCNKTSQRKLSLSCKNLIQIRITFLIFLCITLLKFIQLGIWHNNMITNNVKNYISVESFIYYQLPFLNMRQAANKPTESLLL